MASLAGNSNVDIRSMSTCVAEVIEKAFHDRFPYVSINNTEVQEEGQYDAYFKMLEEMDTKNSVKMDDSSSDSSI